MGIQLGREICGRSEIASTREWFVTNGIGGYAAGTIAGSLTRRYHGILIAALQPPLGRTLLVSKVEERIGYGDRRYELSTNVWRDGSIHPQGYQYIEQFALEGSIPTWRYACADALLEKQIWMQQGENTTYISYRLLRATQPLMLQANVLVNYRDYHSDTQNAWSMDVRSINSEIPIQGVKIQAFPDAAPIYLLSDRATATPAHNWYYGFDLAVERYRGLSDREHHLHAATFQVTLKPGESVAIVASTELQTAIVPDSARQNRHHHEVTLLTTARSKVPNQSIPDWIEQLILAADQFIVDRATPDFPTGKTIIAGYPWFSDWGRDTMISLPGLTLCTGRPDIAQSILLTFSKYVDRGMIPNRFPDAGEVPEYNTVDATLWYIEAIRAYYYQTGDEDLLKQLFPVMQEIIDWHCQGTRYQIHVDPEDGLLYAGEPGVQLTWMDAKVGDWVVTPRIGKPIEINALWYNAVRSLAKFARQLQQPHQDYDALADRIQTHFAKFWNAELGYCYDVLDGPEGADPTLRPNQLFAIALPALGTADFPALLNPDQQKAVVDRCAQHLLTSHGLRSLSPDHPHYQGHYGGTQLQRDGAYHQGTVWGWLLGVFAIGHFRVYGDAAAALQFLQPMAHHLLDHGVGSLSEIFDGDAPMTPRGCFAQAWTVAEVLRAWFVLSE
ncbi:amylo-alpha-1,6-glucosidase [Alkalinema pantanalense CENA528]|uniref:amylo-alpha-1,6-glucosidase n=1 Tax=Alkalinema pantanalense TaxID=1620705 RepID=UPI003D6E4DD6